MNRFLSGLSIFLFVSNVSAADCVYRNVTLTLNSASGARCSKMAPNGDFEFKTCKSGRGLLSKGIPRDFLLFTQGTDLVSRREVFDYDTDTQEIELLTISQNQKTYAFDFEVKNRAGNTVDGESCTGSIEVHP